MEKIKLWDNAEGRDALIARAIRANENGEMPDDVLKYFLGRYCEEVEKSSAILKVSGAERENAPKTLFDEEDETFDAKKFDAGIVLMDIPRGQEDFIQKWMLRFYKLYREKTEQEAYMFTGIGKQNFNAIYPYFCEYCKKEIKYGSFKKERHTQVGFFLRGERDALSELIKEVKLAGLSCYGNAFVRIMYIAQKLGFAALLNRSSHVGKYPTNIYRLYLQEDSQ